LKCDFKGNFLKASLLPLEALMTQRLTAGRAESGAPGVDICLSLIYALPNGCEAV
jgi:hypothetical protein